MQILESNGWRESDSDQLRRVMSARPFLSLTVLRSSPDANSQIVDYDQAPWQNVVGRGGEKAAEGSL